MVERLLFWNYDMAEATNLRYGKYNLLWQPGAGTVTAATSTTVTANTTGAFADVKVGDLFRVLDSAYAPDGPSFFTVQIVTKNSDSEIVVSSALTLTAASPWQYLVAEVPVSGTGSGWFDVSSFQSKTVHPTLTTVAAAGGIDLQVEGKGPNGMISILYSVNYATSADELPIPIEEDVQFLRVGLKGGSGFAGTDVISVVFSGTEKS